MRREKRYAITIDPGFAFIGAGVVELGRPGEMHTAVEAHVWLTEKSNEKRGVRAADDNFRRSREIAKQLLELFARWNPVVVTAEEESPVRSASAARKVGNMVGVLACEVERRSLPYVDASPQEVRGALGLMKGASKRDVQKAVRTRIKGDLIAIIDDAIAAQTSTLIQHEEQATHAWDAFAGFIACERTDVVRALVTRA